MYLGSLRKIKTFHKAATPQFYHKAALSEVNRLREHSPIGESGTFQLWLGGKRSYAFPKVLAKFYSTF